MAATVAMAADVVRHIVCRANEVGLAAGEWICAEVVASHPGDGGGLRDGSSGVADMFLYTFVVVPAGGLIYAFHRTVADVVRARAIASESCARIEVAEREFEAQREFEGLQLWHTASGAPCAGGSGVSGLTQTPRPEQ